MTDSDTHRRYTRLIALVALWDEDLAVELDSLVELLLAQAADDERSSSGTTSASL